MTTFTFLTPLICCFSCALLRYPFSLIEGVSGFLSLIGVILMLQPTPMFPPAGERTVAPVAVLIGALGVSSAALVVRYNSLRTNPSISPSYLVLISISFFTLWFFVYTWLLFLANGILGYVVHYLLYNGLQKDSTNSRVLMLYIRMAFQLATDWLVWNDPPDLTCVTGIFILVGCTIVMVYSSNGRERNVRLRARADGQFGLRIQKKMEVMKDKEQRQAIDQETSRKQGGWTYARRTEYASRKKEKSL